jgi:hypothetical protein
VEEGIYTLEIVSLSDKAKNALTNQRYLFRYAVGVVIVRPEVVSITPEDGALVNRFEEVSVQIKDNSGRGIDFAEDKTYIVVKDKGGQKVSGKLSNDGNLSLKWRISTPLSRDGSKDGKYTIEVNLRDKANNTSAYFYNFTFDSQIPTKETTNVLTVVGTILDKDNKPVLDALSVEVVNSGRGLSDKAVVGSTGQVGQYSITFLDPNKAVAETGDILVVTVKDAQGNVKGKTEYSLQSEDVKASIVTVNVILREISKYTLHLRQGINMISVPLKPEQDWRLSNLAQKIGPELTFLIYYDTTSGKFVSYLPSFPETVPTNIQTSAGQGYIALMKSAKDVTLEGTAWDGKLALNPGINIVSLPLMPPIPWRLSDLASLLGESVSMLISYDATAGKFISYLPTFPKTSPFNVAIEGGTSYIVIMKEAKTVHVTGSPWEN